MCLCEIHKVLWRRSMLPVRLSNSSALERWPTGKKRGCFAADVTAMEYKWPTYTLGLRVKELAAAVVECAGSMHLRKLHVRRSMLSCLVRYKKCWYMHVTLANLRPVLR
jgi:hypothetical protein